MSRVFRIIPGNWIRILWFVSTLANSFKANEPKLGRKCNRRLYEYYRTLAPQLPNSFREMEPLFLSVICGCNAGLFHEALHEVYIPRIQRGDVYFAANVLGARGALLLALVHFFEHGRWGVTGRKLLRGTRFHRGRPAFHPHAGGAIPHGHARFGSTGSADLLRARSPCVVRLIVPCF